MMVCMILCNVISLFMVVIRTLFLKERTPKILNSMAELADQYKDARDLTAIQVTQTGKSKTLQKKPESNIKSERTEPKDKNDRFVPKIRPISPECRSTKK